MSKAKRSNDYLIVIELFKFRMREHLDQYYFERKEKIVHDETDCDYDDDYLY